MFKKYVCSMLAVFMIAAASGVSQSWARGIFGDVPEESPSVIDYAWRGLAIGTLAGLSAGYVRYADERDNTEDIARSLGYGSLAGAGVGILVGLADAASGKTGIGGIILRDMRMGGSLGLVLGTIWGGIDALGTNQWESVGKGAAWGYLGGVVLGLGIGIIEAPELVSEEAERKTLRYGMSIFEDSQKNICPALSLSFPY
ncbi:MAG: hypothetical protein A2219_05610 [Elusimicrobia bacterium RIFOXYA2_FULL_50_26]|nr:MAG: hypothetical protein A2219_05610 [Elusimicrobia bacterium RIFOXYA2_FULL_50_26]OGS23920.1 MAG: hypothetical protein A2314_07465 [Elusimicrobia bacterium RIFOXYB2_FULL_50_12]